MPEYKWYVEPVGDFTNEYISREANERGAHIIPLRDKMCEDGEHNLWQCSCSFITELHRSQQPLRFVEWVQEGNGKIRRWVPPKRKESSLRKMNTPGVKCAKLE